GNGETGMAEGAKPPPLPRTRPRPGGRWAGGQPRESPPPPPPWGKTAPRSPAASRETPRPSLISSSRQTATHSAIDPPPPQPTKEIGNRTAYDLRPRPPSY